jgi:uncharacterized protein (TIGR02391 family)
MVRLVKCGSVRHGEVMARRLLQIAGSIEGLLKMTDQELAWAMLEDMQARGPIDGMATRNLAGGLLPVGTMNVPGAPALAAQLNKAGPRAFKFLEQWGLAEPANGTNGVNGYVVLTEKGKTTTDRVDFERIVLRQSLTEAMLHPALRGRIHGYYADDDLGTAVFEAFKLVEIELRSAAKLAPKDIGKELVGRAFAERRPLVKPTDDKADREALIGLFGGALHRFKNRGSHTNQTYDDVLEAMEELMLASRLLRMIDERRPGASTGSDWIAGAPTAALGGS